MKLKINSIILLTVLVTISIFAILFPEVIHLLRTPETFADYRLSQIGAPIAGYRIGQYDGLTPSSSAGVMVAGSVPTATPPSEEPLVGPAAGVSEVMLYPGSYASVSPQCCSAATYSTSNGCLCTTPEQQTFINSRGGNRLPISEI